MQTSNVRRIGQTTPRRVALDSSQTSSAGTTRSATGEVQHSKIARMNKLMTSTADVVSTLSARRPSKLSGHALVPGTRLRYRPLGAPRRLVEYACVCVSVVRLRANFALCCVSPPSRGRAAEGAQPPDVVLVAGVLSAHSAGKALRSTECAGGSRRRTTEPGGGGADGGRRSRPRFPPG